MNSNKIIDMIGWIENYPAFIYILDGAYGILGRIMMFMNIKIYSIDRNIKYDYFYVKVLSVLWKSYKFLNGECCNAFYCSLPCQHSFKFYINNKSFGSTNIYAPTSGDKLYRYDHYRFFTSKDLRLKENFNITLITIDVVKRFEVYDVFEISNLSFHPNSISPQIEAVSKHGKNTCTGYTSDNCANICYAIKYVESCDYNNGSIICINGADDIKTCEKCFSSFLIKSQINLNAAKTHAMGMEFVWLKILNDNKLDHNKIKCKCKTGFQGKYCQKWYCVKNCNRNGICEGSNTCNCYPLYKGYQCEMYLADKIFNRNNKTKNCYHHNNSLKCFCNKNFLTLKYCKKILCLQKIDSQANKELLSNVDSKCDCMKYFPGLRCHSTLISVYQMKSKSLLAKLLGSALALLIILLLTIIIRYYRHEHLILPNPQPIVG
ncbi:hypothetical protein HZS_306, partial [Henneguya salminicola]